MSHDITQEAPSDTALAVENKQLAKKSVINDPWFVVQGEIEEKFFKVQPEKLIPEFKTDGLEPLNITYDNGFIETIYILPAPIELVRSSNKKYKVEYADINGNRYEAKNYFRFNNKDHEISSEQIGKDTYYRLKPPIEYDGKEYTFVDEKGRLLDDNFKLVAQDWGKFNAVTNLGRVTTQSTIVGVAPLFRGKHFGQTNPEGTNNWGAKEAAIAVGAVWGAKTFGMGLLSAAGAPTVIPIAAVVIGYALYKNWTDRAPKDDRTIDQKTFIKAATLTALAAVAVTAFSLATPAIGLGFAAVAATAIAGNEMNWSKAATKAGANSANLKQVISFEKVAAAI